MKHVTKPFSCYIIGETSLAQTCGEHLLQHGHTIHGIASPNSTVLQWAEERGIARCTAADTLGSFLQQHPFDYLFSIVNNTVLPERILKLPRQLAINYHDALLPRYGGIHATSWAIMQHDKEHGITWHVMKPRIDAGAVLKQRAVTVTANETAASLNLKCYQAAAGAFAELVGELAAGTVTETQQDLARRTYMPRYKRPPMGCLIDWRRDAKDIDGLVRALDFGQADNPLGVAKIAAGDAFLIVSRLAVLEDKTGAAPGTILAVGGEGVRVATGTQDVLLKDLRRLDGSACPVERLAGNSRFAPGVRMLCPDTETERKLTDLWGELCRHESFWLNRLMSLTPVALPDMRLAESKSEKGIRIFRHAVSKQLRSTAEHSAAECRDVVCGLFGAFLARHTGMSAFSIGFDVKAVSGVSGGWENLFAPVVPLTFAFDPAQPLRLQVGAAVAEIASVRRHVTWALDMKARYAGLEGGAFHMPVTAVYADECDAITLSPEADLTLVVGHGGEEYHLVIRATAIDPVYAESIDKQFQTFLASAAASLDTELSRVPLASLEDEQTMIYAWNDTGQEFNHSICMHQLFEMQAERQPDAAATVYNNSTLTYGELNRQANRIARYLIRTGVKSGALVGVCLERSHDMIAGLLGILKARAAYVPLEPSYPRERIAAIVRTAGIKTIVTQESCAPLVSDTGTNTVVFGRDTEPIQEEAPSPNVAGKSKPDDIAYVIFTSGSTGTPKGVVVTHQPVINLFEWAYRTCGFTADDTVLFVTALSFDLSVFDIFGILGCGGTIHIAGDSQRKDVRYLAHMLCEGQITFWDSAPAALQVLVPLLKEYPRPVRNTRLRMVFLSGDWIPVTMPDDIRQVFPSTRVMALGGATEATVWSNYFDVNVVEPVWRSIPYGRPMQNCRYYILDKRLAVCPPGVVGDLYIAGACLSKGYLNAPELTSQSYVPDPFCNNGTKMYRTGDLARFFPDGTIEFVGRSDFQVKVRGYRIELSEIEHVLRRHTAIKEAIVVVREDAAGVQKLVAYIVAQHGAVPHPRELHEFSARYLTDYMVPNVFVPVQELPLSANGKLDRDRLPWPPDAQNEQPSVQAGAQEEDGALEELLSGYFKQALSCSAIGLDDDFIDLGVTSLNFIQIAEKLSAEHDISLSVEAFLDHTSVRSLAAHIRGTEEICADTTATVCVAEKRQEPPAPPVPAPDPSSATRATYTAELPTAGYDQPSGTPDVFKRIQLMLPLEDFLDNAALMEVAATVRRAFEQAGATITDRQPVPAGHKTPDSVSRTVPPMAGTTEKESIAVRESMLAERITACFCDELGTGSISPDADFIDLGITSLNLIRIAEKLEKQLGLSMAVETFLDHSTINALAMHLGGEQTEIKRTEPVPAASCPAAQTQPMDSGNGEVQKKVPLEQIDYDPASYDQCAGHREFDRDVIPLRTFSTFLALLKEETVQGETKYLYPSAGGLNAVQTYLYVKQDRIEGIGEGIYYYHPQRHVLMPAAPGQAPERAAFHPYSHAVYDAAAFGLFFVTQYAAIKPVYDGLSQGLATLDAGYMGQLLQSRQARYSIGLFPVAGFDGERLRILLGLEETHAFTHTMLGGHVSGNNGTLNVQGSETKPLSEYIRMNGAGLTGHFSGSAPDRSPLYALAEARLESLNALTPEEHKHLHIKQLHIRRFDDCAGEIGLHPVHYIKNEYLLRATQRQFARQPLALGQLSRFMALLKQQSRNGRDAYLYTSAGGDYTVRAYVYCKPDAVDNLASGLYRYDPLEHALQRVSAPGADMMGSAHLPGNRGYYNASRFSLYLVADMDAVQQLYGSESIALAMLEAGSMGQLLMDRQAESGLGLCPIGTMRFSRISDTFHLPKGFHLLHSFVGGPVERDVLLLGHECLKIM